MFCGPIMPGIAPEPTYDMETGERLPDVDRGGASVCDILPLIGAIITSQTLLLMSQPADTSLSNGDRIPPGLAFALAYMNTGAHLLGLVQLLVGLSVVRLGRWRQVLVLWVWALGLGVASWALFRRFIRGGDETRVHAGSSGTGEGALVACVIICVAAAVSPTFVFWCLVCLRSYESHRRY